MKDKKTFDFMPVVIGAVILVVGVLFCFQTSMGIEAISYIVGISMILLGLIYALIVALAIKSTLSAAVFSASALIAFGITFIRLNLAGVLISLLPIFMIVIGSVIFIDAFLLFFVRKGEKKVFGFVIELIVGAIAIALGICILTIDEVARFASIVLGVALAAFGLYIILSFFVRRSKKEGEPDGRKA